METTKLVWTLTSATMTKTLNKFAETQRKEGWSGNNLYRKYISPIQRIGPGKEFCFSKSSPFPIQSPHGNGTSYGTIFAAKWSSNGWLVGLTKASKV